MPPGAVGALAVAVVEPALFAALVARPAAAVIDRIVHHATVLTTAGDEVMAAALINRLQAVVRPLRTAARAHILRRSLAR